MERSVLQGLAALRWGAWIWAATALFVGRHDLRRPWLAVLLIGLALVVTVGDTILLRIDASALLRPARSSPSWRWAQR